MSENIQTIFGTDVFDKRIMKAMLSSEIFKRLEQTIDEGKELEKEVEGGAN